MKRQFFLIPLLAIAMLAALSLTFNDYRSIWAVALTQSQSEQKQDKPQGWQHDHAQNKQGDHANGQTHEWNWSQMHTMTGTHPFSGTTSISSTMTISNGKTLHEGNGDKSGRWHHARHGGQNGNQHGLRENRKNHSNEDRKHDKTQ